MLSTWAIGYLRLKKYIYCKLPHRALIVFLSNCFVGSTIVNQFHCEINDML